MDLCIKGQDVSCELMDQLDALRDSQGFTYPQLAQATDLPERDLRRWLQQVAPDEMDVEALVLVALVLGYTIRLEPL